jgi:hypothetical protein
VEEHKRGNTGDAKPLSDAGQRFGVHFRHQPSSSSFGCDFDQLRRHHFAGTAPGRPEIHEHRKTGAPCDRGELLIGLNIDGLRYTGQFRLAFAATECFSETFVVQAISLATFLASYQDTSIIKLNSIHPE